MSQAVERNVADDLGRWVVHRGGPTARVEGLGRMPGHSGITYRFTIVDGDEREDVVMRVPPPGVRHQANLDVVRLAPVLDLTRRHGVRVPRVVASSNDLEPFGVPFLMVSLEPGAPLPDVFDTPADRFPDSPTVRHLFGQALGQLARIHAIDASPLLDSGWARPVTPEDDLAQWLPLLEKSESPVERARTHDLGSALAASVPPDEEITIVHGDFYSNNWLFDDGEFSAMLDWENCTLARPMWDLGWAATLYDPACWGPSRSSLMSWGPSPEDLYTWYEETGDRSVTHPSWYQALMCYRLACITPAKVRLHRSGRRVDPIWEVFAEAIPFQLDRAFALLAGRDR